MAVHVVTSHNQHLYAKQLDEMFRMRHEFYVKQRGWTNLTSSDGRETDEFDDAHAVYLMNLDRFGHIVSTFRLNPTTGPYLLADKLPHYLSEPAPRREDIWDISRWMVAPQSRRRKAGEIAEVQQQLIVGLMEFAVDRGITNYTTLTDTAFIERIKSVWPIRFLGEVCGFDDAEGEARAVMIEAGPHILVSTRNKTNIYDTVLFELKPEDTIDDDERNRRENAVTSQTPLNRERVDQIQVAANHLIKEIELESDIERSVKAIDEFTDFIKGITNDKLEDA